MCRRVVCRSCGKPGYAGCGRHVDEVLAGVPRSERCACGEGGAKGAERGAEKGTGWLGRLLGRR
ncbi:hypothetical protein [Kitasatospora sp. NPDC058218]|uniref:hypothetical protein n=1 Tax=Kitasatospora sp. NPDC058218 TaxID=3346385 RepID=UPI0036DF57A6